MIEQYDSYAKSNGFKLNPDKKTVERVMNGLLANEKKYGKRYCPCRRVSGNEEEDAKKICPCVFHREEIEKDGHCFCNLFVK
jgi:ferredoxin-thioredoxin reductase catalytic chain